MLFEREKGEGDCSHTAKSGLGKRGEGQAGVNEWQGQQSGNRRLDQDFMLSQDPCFEDCVLRKKREGKRRRHRTTEEWVAESESRSLGEEWQDLLLATSF